jgi:hypothetical protein
MRIVAVVMMLAGCATRPPIEPQTACRMVRDNQAAIASGSPKDLAELAFGTPAQAAADGAIAQQRASTAMFVMAALALGGGLVTALATNPGTDPNARNVLYGLGGGVLGLGVVAMVLRFTLPRSVERARTQLRAYADHCQ